MMNCQALAQLPLLDPQMQIPTLDVNFDGVSLLHHRNGAPASRLWRDVADTTTQIRAREGSIGDQSHRVH